MDNKDLILLEKGIEGEMFTDKITKTIYSTDASAYKETPLAVVRPKNKNDIKELIKFANTHNISLIPRTAGTSLAGQVVGKGIVVDVSRHMNNILEINQKEQWVKVQPGVVLDELNMEVAKYGLFFGPETSTANRCMIGGMVGNNACGAHSLIYGSTRDHLLEIETILSDGTEVIFGEVSKDEFHKKMEKETLEGRIYKGTYELLNKNEILREIKSEFPDEKLARRNTGYAIDLIATTEIFTDSDKKFNFCRLLAGSEGTLAFSTSIKLNLIPLPPKEKGLICAHFETLEEALNANLIALKYNPGAIELIDSIILECTKSNIEQRKNRFFINGEPGAVLVIEFARETREEIETLKSKMEEEMRKNNYGYHFPLIFGPDINKVWALRKAGLGLLSNIPGDAKAVSVIEDTAVLPELLPDYIYDFKSMLSKKDLSCVYHAHIATGELHLRPVLNLKDKKDVELFHQVAEETAYLVKKYRGSLSGEHGDGRLRGEFIPIIIGEKNFELVKKVKFIWDPNVIFNRGKIVDSPRMNTSLRYTPGDGTREFDTIFDYSETKGFMRLVEQCNGSGDCRKSEIIGGTMCPSYQATRDEDKTTRARANILREYLTKSSKNNPFDQKEIYQILDLCLSCKGCKSECPSSVDMAKLKAEFLQHYYDANGVPFRAWLIAYISSINKLGSFAPWIYNLFVVNKLTSSILKSTIGFAKERSMPTLYKTTLKKWAKRNLKKLNNQLTSDARSVYLFIDEFTDYNDTQIGIIVIKLLNKLGYKVLFVNHKVSGRTFLSKGLLRKAKKLAIQNIEIFKDIITDKIPLIGIEPSAILAFRDEYPDLATNELRDVSKKLAKNTLMIDEFLANEIKSGVISKSVFTKDYLKIKLHGHCQQKSIASTLPTKEVLSFPENYVVEEIKSGCCGMAGSFGYEKEHYDLSQKVGELVLFPEVRKMEESEVLVANGTSCRHQVKDGTQKSAKHLVEVMWEALV